MVKEAKKTETENPEQEPIVESTPPTPPQPPQPPQPMVAPVVPAVPQPQYAPVGQPQPPQPMPVPYYGPQQPGAVPQYYQQVQNPGQSMGIASLITSLFGLGLVGVILGIIGLNQSKKANQGNGMAIAGIVIGAIGIIVTIIWIILMVIGATMLVQRCNDLGPGTHYVGGTKITCDY